MTRQAKKYLFDILQSIDRVANAHLGLLNTVEYAQFEQHETVQRAIEREITIIGEACRQLQRIGVILTFSDSMINRRNTLNHQYEVLKPPALWRIAAQQLPQFRAEVQSLLDLPDTAS